jgi:hypothetical protein
VAVRNKSDRDAALGRAVWASIAWGALAVAGSKTGY